MGTSWEELEKEAIEQDEEYMRPFKSLSFKKKVKRVCHEVWDFLRFSVIGGRGCKRGIRGALYWLRCHTYDRYHMIDTRTKGTGDADYSWGWQDRDHLMLLACFKLLVDYVELERPFEFINWESDEGHSHAAREMKELYDYWKSGRKKICDERESIPLEFKRFTPTDVEKWKKYRELSDLLEKTDQENLERLVKIRGYMWT